MKKEYIKPQVAVVELEIHSSMLAGSPNPPEWAGEGSSREMDQWDEDE